MAVSVDGTEAARTSVPRTVPAAFSATESFYVGMDLGSPVSLAYEEQRPSGFDGRIRTVTAVQ